MVPTRGLSTDHVMSDGATPLFVRVNVTDVGPETVIVSPTLLVSVPDRGVPPSLPPVDDPVPMMLVPPAPVSTMPPPAPLAPPAPATVLGGASLAEHDARTADTTNAKK